MAEPRTREGANGSSSSGVGGIVRSPEGLPGLQGPGSAAKTQVGFRDGIVQHPSLSSDYVSHLSKMVRGK